MHRQFIILSLAALVCLIVLFPLRVAATALGDMRVFSTPVQALLAEAEIYAPGKYGQDDFQVEILPAPGGVSDYPYSSLHSDIIRGQGGRLLIRLRGDGPLTGKRLAIRLALRMPGQRLIRNYELRQQPSVVLATQTAHPTPATTVGTYIVKPGDTLWRLAGKLRPDRSISIPDMLKVLYRANPQAFTAGDINRLKLGARLRIPALQQASPTLASPATGQSGAATVSTRVMDKPRAQQARPSESRRGPTRETTRPDGEPTVNTPVRSAATSTADLQRSAVSLVRNTRLLQQEMQRMNARIRALRAHLERNNAQVQELGARLRQKAPAMAKAPASVAPSFKPVQQPLLSTATVSGSMGGRSWLHSGPLLPASLAVLGLMLLWLMVRGIGRHMTYKRNMRELKSQDAVLLDIVSQKADERLRKEASLRSGSYLPPQSGQVVQLDRYRDAG